MYLILEFGLGISLSILIISLFANFVLPHLLIFLWKTSIANKEGNKK